MGVAVVAAGIGLAADLSRDASDAFMCDLRALRDKLRRPSEAKPDRDPPSTREDGKPDDPPSTREAAGDWPLPLEDPPG